jgi:hypothetical protein
MRRWLNNDARLLLGSLVALTLLGVLTVMLRPAPPAPPLSVRSAAPEGAMALRLWLEASGYRVREVLTFPDDLDNLDALLVLDPILPYEDDDRRAIYNWLRQGNTLIVAGNPFIVNTLLTEDLSLRPLFWFIPESIVPAAPTLRTAPFEPLPAQETFVVESDRDDAVIHLTGDDVPVLMSSVESQGTVWVSGMVFPFSNLGLQHEAHARLILNLLAGLPRRAVIGFDEAHHGYGQGRDMTVFSWLVTTAPGWGVLSGMALTFVYLTLRGRRFGRAVPLPEERLRREPVEYIQAMANLFRRSGQREDILRHYRQQFRRKLSERYAVDPRLDDSELLKTIVYREPSIDEAQLRGLLQRLAKKSVSEAELLAVVRDVDAWLSNG